MYKIFKVFAILSQLMEFVTLGIFNRSHVITQNPVTGRMSGNIANTRFGVWRGINVAASIGLKEQRKPQTLSTAVILNRAKMKLSGHTMIELVSAAPLMYPVSLIGTTPFAKVLGFFRKKLIGIFSALTLDITQLINTTIGNGLPIDMMWSTAGGGLVLNIAYDLGSSGPHFSDDATAIFLVVNSTFTKAHYIDTGQPLSAMGGTFVLPLTGLFPDTDTVMIWVGLKENDTFTGFTERISKLISIDTLAYISLT